jgi:hypothetical protein
MPQYSRSVSSEATTFFRAQGVPVTLELPLPPLGEVSRTANLPQLSSIEFESDFPIRQLANRVGLHSGFGPSPSVEMLIKELAQRASSLQAMLPLKAPLQAHEWNTFPSHGLYQETGSLMSTILIGVIMLKLPAPQESDFLGCNC